MDRAAERKDPEVKKIIQFGYNVKVPEGIPLVDCRVIPNPWNIGDPVAQRHAVRNHPSFPGLVDEAEALLKSHPVIGVGCGYGVHRSGTVVDALERRFRRGQIEEEFEVEKWGKA